MELDNSGKSLWVSLKSSIEFKGGFTDPCLMIKRMNNGTVFATIYIDDNFCVIHTPALKSFVDDLKRQGLTVKVCQLLALFHQVLG